MTPLPLPTRTPAEACLHPTGACEAATAPAETVQLCDVLSALSFALDLTEGAVPGHAIRTCLLGMRIGTALKLDEPQLSDLYYALLLKDIGCSSNAARMSAMLGGDERRAKQAIKLIDWTDSGAACATWAAEHVLPGAALWRKTVRLLHMKRHGEENNVQMFRARCERGGAIARKIGVAEGTVNAIYSLDEHWNGKGYPDHLKAAEIPLLSRILAIAQHLDVLAESRGQACAIQTLRERSGRWFDPDLVRLTESLHNSGRLWAQWNTTSDRAVLLDLEPGGTQRIGTARIDRICEAFAEVVDAKSPMTYRHSVGVTEAADAIAAYLRLEPERCQLIHRAALLHDIGKLGLPNTILDKRGELTREEWISVREHPALSFEILARIASFEELASIAGRHHERLDGSGYPRGLKAEELTLEDGILAAADVFGTLSEDRPYRAPMEYDAILSILRRLEHTGKLFPFCCRALREEMEAGRLQIAPARTNDRLDAADPVLPTASLPTVPGAKQVSGAAFS